LKPGDWLIAMLEKVNAPAVARFGPFSLDVRSGELRNGSTRLKVPDQSIAILQALLERPGELVTREALRDRLWGSETFVDYEAGLNAAVRRLREALHDSADTPRYVETLPRRGYRFIAPVDGALAGADAAPAEPATVEAPVSAAPATARAGRARVRPAVLVALGLAAIGVALWAGLRWRQAAPTAARPVPITRFPGLELDPAISADGKLVAFAWEGQRGDNLDIYVRSIEGSSDPRPLTTHAAADHAPAWSPNGQRIAFVRVLEGKREVIVLPALGGTEARLFEAAPERGGWEFGAVSYGLSWTPDGNHLVFGDRSGSATNSAIYLYSFENGERRQLTHPPANTIDIHPIVSPNGRYLAFVRGNATAAGPMGSRLRGGNIFLQKLEQLHVSGEPTQLTFGPDVVQAFDWAPDSRSIIHDGGQPGLWRVAVPSGAPEPVLPNIRASRPSVARSGAGVVYQHMLSESHIWELPTPSSPSRQPSGDATFRVVASTSTDTDMQFSPDGTRIAFGSLRSGHGELWVSNRDGSQANKLTNFAGSARVGSPAWSADGTRIAFDAIMWAGGGWNLYIVAADGGSPVKPLTGDAFHNVRPSWSIDGRWIYFASDRTGDWQIWKMPSSGGTASQVTFGGGREPVVSWDGRRVYYAKTRPTQGIWAVPVEGGQEIQVVPRGRDLHFDIAENGIFLLDASAKPQATVEMFRFATQQLETVARLPPGVRFPSYFRVTRDGSSMLYQQWDQWHSDIEMLPGIR
jgi:Tol biopolymer transport system component/DNA-binding winged helix-turn-helix (wHTH) protein